MDRLVELRRASPLVPFSVVGPKKQKIRVPRPDSIWGHPDRRTTIVVAEGGRPRLLSRQMLLGVERERAAA